LAKQQITDEQLEEARQRFKAAAAAYDPYRPCFIEKHTTHPLTKRVETTFTNIGGNGDPALQAELRRAMDAYATLLLQAGKWGRYSAGGQQ
jgi:hypothetical protein